MQGQKARSWRFKIGTSQLRETTLTENIGPPGYPKFGHGAENPTLEKTLVTKSEEAIAGYFSWQKLLRKVRDHTELKRWADRDDDEIYFELNVVPRVNNILTSLSPVCTVRVVFVIPPRTQYTFPCAKRTLYWVMVVTVFQVNRFQPLDCGKWLGSYDAISV
jgi:hypothetical protein